MEGRIIKGIGGYYYVASGGEEYECRARGKFRLDNMTPAVGDIVRFILEGKAGYIMEILPRRNALTRPYATNIDQLIIVLTTSTPKPDLLLADKLMLSAGMAGIEPIICINKSDRGDQGTVEEIAAQYRNACDIIKTSALSGEGLEELNLRLQEKVSCFAGQSAVGKSSLINALLPQAGLETGGLSRKTDRGRHTTRQTTLLPLGSGFVLDTPGFSLLEMNDCLPEHVAQYYREMKPLIHACRFAKCLHMSEPDCMVKKELEAGRIAAGRYERYLTIINELILTEKKKYD